MGESEILGLCDPEIESFSTIHKWSGQQIKVNIKTIKFNADENFNKNLEEHLEILLNIRMVFWILTVI